MLPQYLKTARTLAVVVTHSESTRRRGGPPLMHVALHTYPVSVTVARQSIDCAHSSCELVGAVCSSWRVQVNVELRHKRGAR